LSTKINKFIYDRNSLFALDRQMSAQIHISKIGSIKDYPRQGGNKINIKNVFSLITLNTNPTLVELQLVHSISLCCVQQPMLSQTT
jgi:hypothetical protein